MFKTLRIVSTVLCALLLAFIIPSVVWFKPVYVIIEAVLALLFFVLMMLFKSLQEMREPQAAVARGTRRGKKGLTPPLFFRAHARDIYYI